MKLGKAKRLPPRPPSPDEVSDGEKEQKTEIQSTPSSFSLSSSPPTTTTTTTAALEPILSSPNRASSAVEFTSPTRRKQNLEPGDDEEFEIMDFHLASSWERFIAAIEKTLRSWGLHNGGNGNGETTQPLVQNISYAHRQYQLSLHLNASGIESSPSPTSSSSSSFFFSSFSPFSTSLSPSLHHMMDLEGDFPSRAHHLTRWFGVREFLIISPLSDVGADLSEASLLLSSLTIATQNSSCHVPVFVPVKERWKGVYIGYCAWNGLTTHLECECLPSIPGSFISQSYLSALMKSFASKLGTVGDPNEKISLSLRQTHMRQGYSERNWRTCLLNITPPNFPWGPSADPVEGKTLPLLLISHF
jgi:Rab3 GTPase-activating protein catalytic subunit